MLLNWMMLPLLCASITFADSRAIRNAPMMVTRNPFSQSDTCISCIGLPVLNAVALMATSKRPWLA